MDTCTTISTLQSDDPRVKAAARALPDALFDEDADVQAMREVVAAIDRSLGFGGTITSTTLNPVLEELGNPANAAKNKSRVAVAALNDVQAGDLTFPRALAVKRQIEDDRLRLEVASALGEFLAYWRAGSRRRLEDEKRLAESALREGLLARKREYILSHPELAATVQASADSLEADPLFPGASAADD